MNCGCLLAATVSFLRDIPSPVLLMKIKHIVVLGLAGVLNFGFGSDCYAQNSTPTIKCDAASKSVCEYLENLSAAFVIDGVDGETVKSYSRLVVTYDDGSHKTANFDCSNQIIDGKTTDITLGSGTYNVETGHAEKTLTIISAYLENSASDHLDFTIAEPSSLTWHVYGTPVAGDDVSDQRRLSILGDADICGFSTTLETGSAWSDVSSYEWTVSNNSEFTIVGDGPNATLAQRNRYSGGIYSSTTRTTTVTVRQSVGGTCTTEYSKQITLLGQPEATLSLNEYTYPDGAIHICTSSDDADDIARDFSAELTISGEAPMSATLSTGDKYTSLSAGFHTLRNAHASTAGRVTITELADANGCVSNASSDDMIHGGITVRDRKPVVSFASDSVYCETTEVALNSIPTDDYDNFIWGILPTYRDYNAGCDSQTSSAYLWSNMEGKIGAYVVEVAPSGLGFVECPSDTATISVYFDMPLRYPNAFSPNGDGKNDYLVIERLPAQNNLYVYNSRGKIIYERANYRNGWAADGLDDGYYVYVLKGDGIQTIKETLAIKRTTN